MTETLIEFRKLKKEAKGVDFHPKNMSWAYGYIFNSTYWGQKEAKKTQKYDC